MALEATSLRERPFKAVKGCLRTLPTALIFNVFYLIIPGNTQSKNQVKIIDNVRNKINIFIYVHQLLVLFLAYRQKLKIPQPKGQLLKSNQLFPLSVLVVLGFLGRFLLCTLT